MRGVRRDWAARAIAATGKTIHHRVPRDVSEAMNARFGGVDKYPAQLNATVWMRLPPE